MKHYNYTSLYDEIVTRQKKELIDALQKFPNHEFHFGMDYNGGEQKKNAEYPYIIGYLGDVPASLKVMAVQEKDNCLYILVKDEEYGFEGFITDVKLDIVLGHLENVLDGLPDM